MTATAIERGAATTVAPPDIQGVSSTWYVVQGGNDISWRVESPARLVGGKVCVIPEEGGLYALTQPNNDSAFRWGLDVTHENHRVERVDRYERWFEITEAHTPVRDIRQFYMDHEGTAVWIRPDICRATHAKAMREQHGIRTVAELDDNYLSDPKLNIYMRQTIKEGEDWQTDHMKAVCSMDAIAVSTRWLRDYYWRKLKAQFGKRLVPPIHVCGNHIDPAYKVERIPPRDDGRLRIGYMGSGQHIWDIRLIYPALKWAYDQGHEIVFVGINPADTDPEWGEKLEYTWVPWQKPGEYQRNALPLDIGLAPLVVNDHTLGKSDIKGMEYLLSGAAPVVQNCEVYNRTFRHNETALLAGGREEFLYWTQQLVNSRALRERLVADGNQYIEENRMIYQHEHEWREAIEG